MSKPLRHAVSKKKRRLQKDGFDLDMAYITDNIIAMGYPSSGREAIFRNPWTTTKKFLDKYHAGHYRLYNLCSEREYDHAKFDGNVVKFGFDDHNPPSLQLMVDCCENVEEYLGESEENTAAIHCKAGKGRTGTIICCYLVHIGHFETAADSMAFYGAMRTHDQQGVTIPSQRRYVTYYEQVVKHGGIPTPVRRRIESITFSHVPKLGSVFAPTVRVFADGDGEDDWPPPLTGEATCDEKAKAGGAAPFVFNVADSDVFVHGNTRIEIFNGKTSLMHFWLHSGFLLDEIVIPKKELDDARKDKLHKKYPPVFTVTVAFVPLGGDDERPVFPNGDPVDESVAAASSSLAADAVAVAKGGIASSAASSSSSSAASSSSSSSKKKKTPRKKRAGKGRAAKKDTADAGADADKSKGKTKKRRKGGRRERKSRKKNGVVAKGGDKHDSEDNKSASSEKSEEEQEEVANESSSASALASASASASCSQSGSASSSQSGSESGSESD
jgi:phosphatidylinositol-3,4,5-trisphosphate 3-phosphatase and dual-specificity protein phosphatase PTEN